MIRLLTVAERERAESSLRTYRGVVAALESLLAEGWPTDEQLDADPEVVLLDMWREGSRQVPIFKGMACNHPVLGTSWTSTSALVAVSTEHKLARTESRWYRLGGSLASSVAEKGMTVVGEVEDDDEIVPTCEPRR